MSMLMSLMLLKPPHGGAAPPPPHMAPPSGGSGAGMALAAGIIMIPIMLAAFALALAIMASFWKIHVKAGQPGWTALVPIMNVLVLGKIIGKPGWWLFVPFLNIYASIVFPLELAKVFGQSTGFGVGLILLPIVFYPMLAFGSATYQGAPGNPPVPAM
jgi:hypothetical protein